MKRSTWIVATGAAASLALASYNGFAQGNLPEPTAEAVWNYLQTQNYEQWSFWPGTEGFYEGTRPHGAQLKTYINPIAEGELERDVDSLPTGSTIVKENYSPDKKLMAVTVMYKAQDGYNPEHNNWFWLKRLADGTVEASGKVDSCQACHQSSSSDYLLSPLPQ
jgi:hypothetical protein